jgi:hypothetical protein
MRDLVRKRPPEQIAFIKENIAGRGYAEMADLFNGRFGTSYSDSKIRHAVNCHISDMAKKRRKCGVGSEIKSLDYIKIKLPDGKFKNKNQFIWEAANGPVPEGHAVIFADGDKQNFAPENLLLVSRVELGCMNAKRLIFSNAELTKTGLIIARLKMLERKRKRELKGVKK